MFVIYVGMNLQTIKLTSHNVIHYVFSKMIIDFQYVCIYRRSQKRRKYGDRDHKQITRLMFVLFHNNESNQNDYNRAF